ncbi:hypothetical protein LZ519_07450 [Sphingomonas sp. RG327]|jgi:hypothetical protein|uniref:Uncharacterized protein n=1 Tax=Sphingomonas anseongensis TaxID=2908207 RepID=A0ABT0RFY6_9SPHN|nr:hypothetical protein [Sphingomonas anseongensis]MCL6679149.1 hypothetical protein [Sphingomonas anseongensis]
MESDLAYFSHRAEEELRAAGEAGNTEARRAHMQLASRYTDLAQGIMAHERVLFGHDVHQRHVTKQLEKRVGIWL